MERQGYRMKRPPESLALTYDAEKYLRKIIEYCQKNEIEITLFSSPIYELQVLSTENYDAYIEQIKQIAKEYQVKYYDFNVAKEENLSIQNIEMFMDPGHLNVKGARMFTEFFYTVISMPSEENKELFYNSYMEKMRNNESNVYGIYYYSAVDNNEEWFVNIASNRATGLEYKVIMTGEDGEQKVYQEFSNNKSYRIPKKWVGICTILWREQGQREIKELNIEF